MDSDDREFYLGDLSVSARSDSVPSSHSKDFPSYAERGFRWARETIGLIYAHHQHPVPMVALIFMYADTLGKPLAVLAGKKSTIENRVCTFVESYLPNLWKAFEQFPNRSKILGDHYRNGLAHELFMKDNAGIHEGAVDYVLKDIDGIPYSINIDRLVPEFLSALASYQTRLKTDAEFLKAFEGALGE